MSQLGHRLARPEFVNDTVLAKESDILRLFGGFPFLDAELNIVSLLTAVGCMRRIRHEIKSRDTSNALKSNALNSNAPIESYLDPTFARSLYSTSEMSSLGVSSKPIDLRMRQRVEAVQESICQTICQTMPEWRPLFLLPVEILCLESDSIWGYSNIIEPQHAKRQGK